MKITFIGGGNMATALIGGLIAKGHKPADIRVVEIDSKARARLTESLGVICFSRNESRALEDSQVIVLAVKPQQMRSVAVQLGPLLTGQIIVSIAAGIRLVDLARWLGNANCMLVRAMPNTPALIGDGITGLCAYSFPPAPFLSQQQRESVETLVGAVGKSIWVGDERDMNAVTAISGSGPAYVFLFVEAMQQAARELGLTAEQARALSIQTFVGAARLAEASTEDISVLRERVTSKGGTTEAALASMARDGVKEAIVRAIRAANERGLQLGEELGRD